MQAQFCSATEQRFDTEVQPAWEQKQQQQQQQCSVQLRAGVDRALAGTARTAPALVLALARTWLSAWSTTVRLRRGRSPCRICGAGAADELPHLLRRERLWQAVVPAVGTAPPDDLIGGIALREWPLWEGRQRGRSGRQRAPESLALMLAVALAIFHKREPGRRDPHVEVIALHIAQKLGEL